MGGNIKEGLQPRPQASKVRHLASAAKGAPIDPLSVLEHRALSGRQVAGKVRRLSCFLVSCLGVESTNDRRKLGQNSKKNSIKSITLIPAPSPSISFAPVSSLVQSGHQTSPGHESSTT